MVAQFSAQMNCVERLAYYSTEVMQEADAKNELALVRTRKSTAPPATPAGIDPAWPAHGAVEFRDVHLRYGKLDDGAVAHATDVEAAAGVHDLTPGTSANKNSFPLGDEVLHGVSFSVRPGQKLGIVGRTGSGKSSLGIALFRIVEPCSGAVLLDGVDTSTVPLAVLRSRLSIIPQDPVLFSTTLRENLDPFNLHDDAALTEALGRVRLGHLNLNLAVAEGGSNLSVGERQLLCIARALLRKSSIILFDEASASIDSATDAFLQAAIRVLFADATVLTIAHRLTTVADADTVLVMDAGIVAESGTPAELLRKPDGAFRAMVERLGPEETESITRIAEAHAAEVVQPETAKAAVD